MSTVPLTRRDIEAKLIEKAWKDPDFKHHLVANPRAALADFYGRNLPDGLVVVVHEETMNTLHLSIPPAPPALAELSDEQLEKVSGGTEVVLMVTLSISASAAIGAVGSAAAGTIVAGGW